MNANQQQVSAVRPTLNECVIIPTFRRWEFLYCCLKRIRKIEPLIPIRIFPDRGSDEDPAKMEFVAHAINDTFRPGPLQFYPVPRHEFYGNSYNTMEAYRHAYNEGWDRVHYIEDDVMVHEDYFAWHRKMHEDFPDIFASMAWIFNRYAPIVECELFQPWFYSVGVCFNRQMLGLVVKHANPIYYADLQKYIETEFVDVNRGRGYGIQHYEQDGLIQRVLDRAHGQTVTPGIARCDHIGTVGYNQGWSHRDEFFHGCKNFPERVERIEELIADPYLRAEFFSRDIVSREIGSELPQRLLKYRVKVPGGWESEFETEVRIKHPPMRVNSVPLPPEAEIVLVS